MYASDTQPLPPILTDGSWTAPFEFFGVDTSHPLDQTGTTWDLTFAPQGRVQPQAADIHVLTSAAGAIVVNSNVVTVTNAAWTGWNPGVYQVELRQLNLANPVPIYVGWVIVAQGLSQLAALGGGSALPSAAGAAVQLFYGPARVQIVRGEASASALQAAASATAAASSATSASQSAVLAQDWAVETGVEVQGIDYCSKEWAIGTFTRGLANGGSSKDWATLTGAEVDNAEYAAKEYAVGTTAPAGSAKSWATFTGAQVNGDYSAKEWAVGTFTRGLAGGGSAKDWATYTGGTVDDTDYSAKHYQALTSADATQTAADRVQTGQDVASATAQANAAATSASQAASNTTATLIDILEKVATYDPAATQAQVAATAARGVTNSAAASSGKQYFRVGLLTSTSLTGVASFTRATSRTATDADGSVVSFGSGTPAVLRNGLHSHIGTTNLCLWSQAFDNAQWSKANATVTADTTAAPDGTTTADKLVESVATASHQVSQSIAVTAGLTYAITVYAKAAERSVLSVSAAGVVTTTDISAFTLSGPGSATNQQGSPAQTCSIQQLGNGWYRCTMIITPNSTGNLILVFALSNGSTVSYAGDGASGLYLWGAQVEQLAFATPYQATTTASASRNADVTQETVNVPVGQAFSVVGKVIAPSVVAQDCFAFALAPAANANDLIDLRLNSTTLFLRYGSNGLLSVANVGTTASVPLGFAISVSGDTVTWSVNGAAATSLTLPGGSIGQALTRLFIGCDINGLHQLNSTIRDHRILDRALSAAECATFSDVSLEWDLDFTTQTYKYLGAVYSSLTDLPLTTFSRGSAAYEVTVAGYVLNVASGVVRACDAGLTIETGATNVALWSRDLTNAVWVASNMTAAKDQTGADGQANSASSITATAANATILQSITLASGNRCQSAFVKRITGAGAVSMTTDGGATWTPVTVGATWAQVAIPAQTLANPTIGFKLATSGDKIAVDYVQNEGGTFPTSPMPTTSATFTRNSDDLHWTETMPAAFSVFAKVTIPAFGPLSAFAWQWDDGQPSSQNSVRLSLDRSNSRLAIIILTGGVVQTNQIIATGVTAGQTYKIAAAFAANDFAVSVNGAAPLTASAGTLPPATRFTFNPSSAGCWGPGILQVKKWRGRRTNAQLQADAA